MQGHYDITLARAGEYTDEQWRQGLKSGNFSKMAGETGVDQRIAGHNLIYGAYSPYIFDHVFSGPTAPDPLDDDASASAALSLITLDNNTAEPAYDTYLYSSNKRPWELDNATPSFSGGVNHKIFIEQDDVAHEVISDPSGRSAVTCRSKFLWTTSQGNANDIYSFAVWHSRNADTSSYGYRVQMGRIRLKDSNGTPMVLVKTSANVLLVEYTFTLTAI